MFKKYLIPLVALAAAALPFACGGGATSGRQQTCSNSGDCKDGLLCIEQTCVQNSYPVTATAKACIPVTCEQDADCCAEFTAPDYCLEYQAQCATQGAGGFFGSDYCELAQQPNCVCKDVCTNMQCSRPETCATNFECQSLGLVRDICDVANEKCVQCLNTEDCADDEKCEANVCVGDCKIDEDCPLFNTCTAGECIETGCTSNRECILYRQRADAECVEGTASEKPSCKVPCQENAECGPLFVCEEGECAYLGCETDEECRTQLGLDDNDFVPEGQPRPRAKCLDLKALTEVPAGE